jgi:hypothetical protein
MARVATAPPKALSNLDNTYPVRSNLRGIPGQRPFPTATVTATKSAPSDLFWSSIKGLEHSLAVLRDDRERATAVPAPGPAYRAPTISPYRQHYRHQFSLSRKSHVHNQWHNRPHVVVEEKRRQQEQFDLVYRLEAVVTKPCVQHSRGGCYGIAE